MTETTNFDASTVFDKLKSAILSLDPVFFCETFLTLDGKPFRLRGNGYKPFVDIYRHIGVKALERDSKPIILVKGRQVGATTMAAALECFWMGCGMFGNNERPPMRVMHCFPQLDLAAAYTKTKLNPMITSAVQVRDPKGIAKKSKTYMEMMLSASKLNDTLQFKEFVNGNHIWIESTGIDASRIRGRTVDAILFDEVQDMPEAALSNGVKVLAKAQYGAVGAGLQVYFGTPKGKGTDYHNMWLKSTQQYYHLGCESCGKLFPLYTPGSNEWEKIWLYGFTVKCIHCGHLQDKRDAAERGKWVGTRDENEPGVTHIGYHINQLYMPEFSRERIEREKPGIHPINTERAWQNEVLGEFYSGQGMVITPEQIRQQCADFERKMRSRVLASENKMIFLGADWGKKVDIDLGAKGEKKTQQGQSYSTLVVLSAEGPESLDIIFATKLKSNELQYKIDVIEQAFLNYNITQAVGDIGYAGDLTEVLQKKFGDKFLASNAAGGNLQQRVKFLPEIFPKTIQFDRNKLIEEMFSLLKKGAIRFPYGSYEHIAWLVNHCCSMETKVTLDRSGNPKLNYVKGATPNDGLMALINAYLAFKFHVSGGFTNKAALFSLGEELVDPTKKSILGIGVSLPKMRTVA